MNLISQRPNRNPYEIIACQYLQSRNLCIIEKNYAWQGGEIDIIAIDQQELVFVEVKYRKDHEFGSPLEKISPAQVRRIHQTAFIFLENTPQYRSTYYRFDALGLSPYSSQDPVPLFDTDFFEGLTVEWIQNAF